MVSSQLVGIASDNSTCNTSSFAKPASDVSHEKNGLDIDHD